MTSRTAPRRVELEHLVATDAARSRLARAAFDTVVDGLDLGPCALRSAADRAWVPVAIAGPIQRAADRALDRLVEDLADVLASGDPELVDRILGHARGGRPATSTRVRGLDRADRVARSDRAPVPVMDGARVAGVR
jgi:hypothetical protein